MFKKFKIKRRSILVFSLVMVLSVISYLNYSINKYSLLETSSELAEYEENRLAEISLKTVENEKKDSNTKEGKVAVVDSKENKVEDVVKETSGNIQSTLSKSTNAQSRNYFIESRLTTNLEREKMVALLNEIIDNEKTDEENRKSANSEKMKLVDIMNKEGMIENLIKAKGFEDALVFITDQSVNVIVKAEKLEDSDMAKILDIVMRETKVPLENIKISNKF